MYLKLETETIHDKVVKRILTSAPKFGHSLRYYYSITVVILYLVKYYLSLFTGLYWLMLGSLVLHYFTNKSTTGHKNYRYSGGDVNLV